MSVIPRGVPGGQITSAPPRPDAKLIRPVAWAYARASRCRLVRSR